MNATELINEVQARGIRLRVDGDRLKYEDPSGVLTDDLKNAIRMHNADIIKTLTWSQLGLPPDFAQRYRAMCTRCRYERKDVIEGLEAARIDPVKAWLDLLADERRTDEERAKWMNA